MKILFSPDPSEGGATPPAAALVAKSDASEGDALEIVRLKREKEDADKKLKERETRLSELEDENRRLKNPPAPPVKEKSLREKLAWLNGY
jgi:hypothetical protein